MPSKLKEIGKTKINKLAEFRSNLKTDTSQTNHRTKENLHEGDKWPPTEADNWVNERT